MDDCCLAALIDLFSLVFSGFSGCLFVMLVVYLPLGGFVCVYLFVEWVCLLLCCVYSDFVLLFGTCFVLGFGFCFC